MPPWNAILPPRLGVGLLSDQLLYFAPWREFMRQEFLTGRFPLWNPYLLAGVPFSACIQAAPFYPLNFGLLWLPAAPFSLIAAFLKIFCAGVFTGLHLRRLGASERGAILSDIVPSGVLPRCLPQLHEHGVDLPASVYEAAKNGENSQNHYG